MKEVKLRNKIIQSVSHLDGIKYLSKCDIDEAKVRDAYKDVFDSLNYYCPESTFSDVIIEQLAMVKSHQCVELENVLYPYIFSELLQRMRLVEQNKLKHKPFNHKDSPLKGLNLYHVHHSLNFESVFNFARYFKRTYRTDEHIEREVRKLKSKYPERDDHFVIFVNEEFLNSVEWESRNKTGEWLVYQIVNGKVNFLALALHETNDRSLFDLVQPHLKSHT